ncbi:polymorphic toxin type 15 domain-containing protein [Burkholderia seminalis]|uniref:polymorphic toxin type 15 domain-containing protein n=1 Tax=Burkholderia seminalis TaxID=488731 RepID=UPI00158BE6AB|nr:polymorphic toxin type 15 domain-containing protein [Burkholderia seminalis]
MADQTSSSAGDSMGGAQASSSAVNSTSRHIANEDRWKAFTTSPDFCKVGNSVVPFDSYAIINNKQTASPNVFAAGKPVYRVGDLHHGVLGDAGQHVVSGTSLGSGYVKILSGQSNVIVNGQKVARDGSACKINCDASGNGGAPGKITTETVPVQSKTCQPNAALQALIAEANDKRTLWQKTKEAASSAIDTFKRLDAASGEDPGGFVKGIGKGIVNFPGDVWNLVVSASKYAGDETGMVTPIAIQADEKNRAAMTAYQAGDVCRANKLASDADEMMQFGHVGDVAPATTDAEKAGVLASAFIPVGGAVKGVATAAKVGRGVKVVNEGAKIADAGKFAGTVKLAPVVESEAGQTAKALGSDVAGTPKAGSPHSPTAERPTVPKGETPHTPDGELPRKAGEDAPKKGEEDAGVHVKPKERLPEKKLPCFHPYDKKNFAMMTAKEQRAYLAEYAKQLRRQEEEINNLTAAQFKAARDAGLDPLTGKFTRNPLADAAQAEFRKKFAQDVQESMRESLRSTMGAKAAKLEAAKRTKELMANLAALHEPDQVAAGWMQPVPKHMGRADVNSSVGGSWNQQDRIASMDSTSREAVANGQGNAKMNVKLEPCRGKGMR